MWVIQADKYDYVCHNVQLTATRDGSPSPQNKAFLGQIVNQSQMGHFIIAQQLVVYVVSGSRVSTYLI